jgi:hypothetical protein
MKPVIEMAGQRASGATAMLEFDSRRWRMLEEVVV